MRTWRCIFLVPWHHPGPWPARPPHSPSSCRESWPCLEPTLASSAGNHTFGNDKKQRLELLNCDSCGMERMPVGRSRDSSAIPGEGMRRNTPWSEEQCSLSDPLCSQVMFSGLGCTEGASGGQGAATGGHKIGFFTWRVTSQ